MLNLFKLGGRGGGSRRDRHRLVVRCQEVADGARVKVKPEELLDRESLAAVEATTSSFSCVLR